VTGEHRGWKPAKLSLILGAVVFSSGGAHAYAQEEAIPDSVAADVEGSETKPAGEAAFAAPPPAVKEVTPEEAAAAEEPKTEVDWSLNAGGAINTGNARSWNLNGGTNFLLSSGDHRLTIASLFNYGRADVAPTDPASSYTTVAKQFFFNARYDYFFTDMDAVWGSLGYRWDPLSGFTAQLMANAGYLRAFIKTEKHYFAGRIGYSYTFENYQVPPSTFTSNSNIQGLLAALDYENKLNEHVEFLSSIVTVYNLNEIEVQNAQPFEDIRIYLTAALLSKLTDKLAFEARFLMLYDRVPAGPLLVNTDTTTIFSLVYTLL
jgi:putative salt-induced outer membrane protein YdiY